MNPVRAWCYLVWLSVVRQARAHWMVWISLLLLCLSLLLVGLNAQRGRWSMNHWRFPPRIGTPYAEIADTIEQAALLPWNPLATSGMQALHSGIDTFLNHGSGFLVYSNFFVFTVFSTFLMPLWTLSFATEGLGREREAGNLLWVLTRPMSRSSIFYAKYLAALPWCLALNLGGFWLLCRAAGHPGRLAWQVYWPALIWGTLAFAALYHLLGAWVRRPALLAILYSFFAETVAGNLPGHLKRLSISYYTRCLMFDRAHDFGIKPERPTQYLPVDGMTAWLILVGATMVLLIVGAWLFSRNEALDMP